jgi:sarcosine oxidase
LKITVVGAGIAGLSSAWTLNKRGHAVTLVEQGPIPNPLAASGDHHRIIRRAYRPDSGYASVITEAFAAWEELWRDLGESHFEARGFMGVSREPGDEAEEYRKGLEAGAYPFDMMTPADAVRRYPFLAPHTFRYAYVSPEGGTLYCRGIAEGLVRLLRTGGAQVLENTGATAVDPERGVVTLHDGEELASDRIVVAAGAWVTKLFPDLVRALTTYRTAVVYLEPPRDLTKAWEAAPVIVDVGGDTDGYILPPGRGAGLKFGSGLHKIACEDADARRVAETGEGEAIRDLFGPPLARLSEYRVESVVTCAYTFTEDERFFATARGKALIVSACSGHGYKFGAAVGKRVAKCVEDGDVNALERWLRADEG